jgi:hypothetical protein
MTTIHYLEMLDRRQFRPTPPPAGFRVERLVPAQPDRNRWFYEAVGRDWQWTDRLVWTDDDWRRYAERPALQTWIGRYYGQEAGYFELEIQQTDVQIAYFGLLPEFIGQGLGGGPGPWRTRGECGSIPAPTIILERYPTTSSVGSRSTRPGKFE